MRYRGKWTVAIAAAPLLWLSGSDVRADPLVPALGDSYFPIGVFYQPANALATTSFLGWKGRGVNTLIGWETQGWPSGGGVSIQNYTTAAANAGLYLIREPSSDPTQDTNSHIIAWLQPDEPDLKGIAPADLQATYSQLQAANATLIANGAISTPRPVLTNFAGGFMATYGYNSPWVSWSASPVGDPNSPNYIPYANYMSGAMAATDWVAQDLYPVTGFNVPEYLGAVGDTTKKLINWSKVNGGPGKPSFAYIETSNQRLFSNSDPTLDERGATPAEVRGEIWNSIIHGARGIIYFPQELDGFQYDATPADVAAEMTKQNATITGLARAINSTDAPAFTNVLFDNGLVEYITRSFQGVTYLIVLNLSDQPTTTTFSMNPSLTIGDLTVLGDNSILPNLGDNVNTFNIFTDTFDPYGVKIYADTNGALLGSMLSVPEPGNLFLLAAAPLILRRRRRFSGRAVELPVIPTV